MTITSSKPPATHIPMMGKTPPGPGGNLLQSMFEIRKKGLIEYFMDSWKWNPVQSMRIFHLVEGNEFA